MKSVLIFGLMLFILIDAIQLADPLEPMESEVRKLKQQILDQMKGDAATHDIEAYKDIYDYIEGSNTAVSPKLGPDALKELEPRTTTTEKFISSPENTGVVGPLKIRKHKTKKAIRSSKKKKKKNVDIFYRRTIFDGNVRDKPQKWTHCLDLLSPFLNGFLSNVSESKSVPVTHMVIRRLTYLLGLNLTDATNEEIRAVLHEISHLQLRLYQWDVAAIKAIMNVIVRDYRHDFKRLKYGIKKLFNNWKLNTSNLTRVLSQSRIFRPPCLRVTEYGGSTVTPRHDHSKFTRKPSKPKCQRRDNGGEDCLDYSDF